MATKTQNSRLLGAKPFVPQYSAWSPALWSVYAGQ